MRRGTGLELLEALGACFVVLGLVFWSLPVALIIAGLFLIAMANAPGPDGPTPTFARRASDRADSRP